MIVLEGDDELDRHLHGGIPLAGRISRPLLDSIFDPHSAGHDGAVVIRDGMVERFAAHLPISNNRVEIGQHGTRHAAALGISEQCDSLTIVVSEERGTVSVTADGRLRRIPTPADLKGRLEQFLAAKFPVQTEVFWKKYLAHHWPLKAIAVVLAVAAWFVFAYNPGTIHNTFRRSPIEYRNVAPGLVLGENAPLKPR